MAAQHSIAAHSAGLADVDVRGDMLATCGYGTRQGQIISDSCVKVLRLMKLPFAYLQMLPHGQGTLTPPSRIMPLQALRTFLSEPCA